MNKKTIIEVVVFLVLSVVVTYGVAIVDFANGGVANGAGFPLGFSHFNFFGGETDQNKLILDIIFWFIVLFVIWKLFRKFTAKA